MAKHEGMFVLSKVQMTLHVVQLMPLPPRTLFLIKIQIGRIILMPSFPGCPGKQAMKRVSLCGRV